MKKIIYFLLIICLLFSCKKQDETDFAYLIKGYIENYVLIVNDDTIISIKYDNREIDDGKLIELLDLKINSEIDLEEKYKKEILIILEKYKEVDDNYLETYIINKDKVYNEINKLIENIANNDLKILFHSINNQKVLYFDKIEKIKNNANYLSMWLEQVKQLERRMDL